VTTYITPGPGVITSAAHVAIVDQSFVDQVPLGRNAVGRRIRFHFPRRSDDRVEECRSPSRGARARSASASHWAQAGSAW
jgi:hypothetical protein